MAATFWDTLSIRRWGSMSQSIEHTGNDARWPLRPGYKTPCSFFLARWDACPLSPEPPCKNSDYLETPSQRGHMEALCSTAPAELSFTHPRPSSRHVLKDSIKTPHGKGILLFLLFQPYLCVTSQPLESPAWGPGHHWAETSDPFCVLLPLE